MTAAAIGVALFALGTLVGGGPPVALALSLAYPLALLVTGFYFLSSESNPSPPKLAR